MNRLMLLLALGAGGCANTPEGAQIDDWCIAGKLSKSGAKYLEETPDAWKSRHADFTAPIKKNFRVMADDCSEALRAFAEGDDEKLKDELEDMKRNDDG